MAIPNVFSKYLPEGGDSSQSDNIFGKYLPEEVPQPEPEEDKGLTSRLTGFLGKSAKTIKSETGEVVSEFQKWPSAVLQAASAIEATLGVGLDKISKPRTGPGQIKTGEFKFLKDVGAKLKNKAMQDMEAADIYRQVNLPIEDSKSFSENVKDPSWIARGVVQNLPNLLTSLGISATVAAITKNPVAAVTAGFGSSFSLEGGFAYLDARKAGVDEEKAEKIGATVGVVNGLLDALPIGRLLSRLPGGNIIKKSILKEVTKSVLKQAALESSTESLQEIVSNAVAKTYDKNRNLFAGTLESAFFGGLMGGGIDIITSIGSLTVRPRTPKEQEEEIKQLEESTGLKVVDVPTEIINFSPEVQKLDEVVQLYKQTAIDQPGSVAIRDLLEIVDTPAVKQETQTRVSRAIESGELKQNEDGTITLYRFGEPKSERLVSVTYDKNYAEQFKADFQGKPIEVKVKPEDIQVFIGKDESEVLVKPDVFPKKVGPAELAAQRIDRRLSGEERLRQSARGMELLKERLAKEEVLTKGTQAEKNLLEAVDKLLSGELKQTIKKVKEKKTITSQEKTDLEEAVKEVEAVKPERKPVAEEVDEREQLMAELAKNDVSGTYFEELPIEELRKEVEQYKVIAQIDRVVTVKPEHPSLQALREATLPEINNNPIIKKLDLFVDKIRKLDPKNEDDKRLTDEGYEYELTVSYPHSLGENGNTTEFIFKNYPSIEDIAQEARGYYKDQIEQINEPLVAGVVAKSARDENIETALKNALQEERPVNETPESIPEQVKPTFELTTQFKKEKGLTTKPKKEKVQRIAVSKDIKTKIPEILKSFTSSKSSLPILKNIAIDGNKAKATDLEIGIIYELGKDVGKIALSAELLKGKNLEELVVDEKERKATIGGLELQGEDIKEFPQIPEVKTKPQLAVSFDGLETGLSQTLKHVATSDTRPELNGVFLKNENGQLRIAATDSFKLNQVYVGAKIDGDFEAILPLNSAKKILKLFKQIKPDTPIEVAIDKKENQIQFKSGKVTVVSRTVDGSYPDYKKILPEKAKIVTTFNKDDLLAAIKESPATPLDDMQIHRATDGKSLNIRVIDKANGISFSKSIPARIVKKEVKVDPNKDLYVIMPMREGSEPAKEGRIDVNKKYVSDYLETADSYDIELLDTGTAGTPLMMRIPESKTEYQVAFSDKNHISSEESQDLVYKYFTPQEVGVDFADQILTPNGLKAFGRYTDSMITFVKNPHFTTPEHEVLHAYFDLFTSPEDKAEILDLVKAQYNLTTDTAAEEKLADDFVRYVRGDRLKFIYQIQEFFKKILRALRALFSNKGNKIQALFDDIINLERKNKSESEKVEKFDEIDPLAQEARKGLPVRRFEYEGKQFRPGSQDIYEPKGTYYGYHPTKSIIPELPRGAKSVKLSDVKFENPLIVPFENWKLNVSKQFGGLKGESLSKEVAKTYDGIITTVDGRPHEIVDLSSFAKVKGIPKELEPLAIEARKYKTAEEFVKGYKQFSKAEEQAVNILNKYGDKNIDVYGSFSTLSRRGSGKRLPDLDVIIEDKSIASDFLKLPENQQAIKSRTDYARKYNTSLRPQDKGQAFASEYDAVGSLTIPEKYLDLSNKFSDVKINITYPNGKTAWFSFHGDGTIRRIEEALQKEQLQVGRKPIKQALEDFKKVATKSQLTDFYEQTVGGEKFQLDLSEFSPEEQQVINLLQDGQEIPENLSGAVASLQTKGVIKPAVKAPVARPTQPLIKLEQGERVSRRGITISRSRQAISRPYRVSYETGDKYVVKTFPTAEDASRRFSAMVELRAKGFANAGELPVELQATDQQKATAHMIAEKKHITPSQFTRLEKIYTGVDSMTKMTPEKGAEFINILKSIKPKFGGIVTISRSQEIVKAEDADRKFHNTTIGWLLDIFRSPTNVFKKIGVYDQAQPLFESFALRRDFLENTFEKLAMWQKELGITRLGSLLTQKKQMADQTRRMFRAVNNPDAKVQLSIKEALIVDRARELADEVADLIDTARQEVGLQPMNRRENYITNLLTEESHYLIQNTKQAPNELYALLDIKMPSNVFDRLLIERKGGLPIKEDFWKSLKVMTQVHSKYIYLNPPIHRFERFMRYWGDKIPALSRKYITGRLNRFLGRPGLIERFLKGVDESITKGLMNIPGLSKEVKLEFDNGLSEIIEVPRITSRFAQRALPILKSIRYTYDLAWSVSFYALNLTQFWVNTVPKLRGNLFEVYGSAVSGYSQMLMDFFRPSKWEYWRKRGVLTEIDNVIDLEFGTRGGADVLNLFAKLSEFNNRVAATLAAEKNMALLAKHGKFEMLYKELANAHGEEAEAYAKNLSDITQFRYGIEEKPVAFDNPVMDLFYQYNTFAIKQAELVEGMIRNVDLKNTWKDYKKAHAEGKTKEFVAELSQGQRAEFIRYILNVFILSMILGMSYVWKAAVKGIVPNQMEGVIDILKGLWDGDKDEMARGWKKFLTPPAYDLIQKVSQYGITATIKNAKVFRQLNLISAALQGEGTIENIEGKQTEKITRGVAIKRLFAPQTEKTAKVNNEGWNLYFELQDSYSDTRKKAMELIQDGKKDEARKLAAEYNKKAQPKIDELTKLGVTDIRLRKQIKKSKKGFIVSKGDFKRWIADAGKP